MAFVADTHVHLYPQFDLRAALIGGNERLRTSSKQYFSKVVPIQQADSVRDVSPAKFLCLTERETEAYFCEFQTSGDAAGLSVLPTGESESLKILLPNGDSFFLVAGRQIVTTERLEVLFLGARKIPATAVSLREAVEWAATNDVLAVLPWSFGKWFGNRGQLLLEFVENSTLEKFVLGDIYMRPEIAPLPPPMKKAGEKGRVLIAGSDPLPVAGEEELIGRSVVWGEGEIDLDTPWRSLSKILLAGGPALQIGGEKGSILSLCSRSVRYRLKKPPSTSMVPSNTSSAGPVI